MTGEAAVERGVVRITASEIVACEILPLILATFCDEHPAIEVELSATNKVHDLLRRDADIAVRTGRPTQKALIARKLSAVPVGLFAHRHYLATHGTPNNAARLVASSADRFRSRRCVLSSSKGFRPADHEGDIHLSHGQRSGADRRRSGRARHRRDASPPCFTRQPRAGVTGYCAVSGRVLVDHARGSEVDEARPPDVRVPRASARGVLTCQGPIGSQWSTARLRAQDRADAFGLDHLQKPACRSARLELAALPPAERACGYVQQPREHGLAHTRGLANGRRLKSPSRCARTPTRRRCR